METKIKFEPVEGAHPTRIAHGEYSHELEGKPPWEATAEEWEKYLKPTGLFQLVGAKDFSPVQHKEVGVGDTGKAKDR